MASKQSKISTLDKTIIQIVKKNNPKNLKQLVELIQQEQSPFPLPREEIMEHILKLQKQGELVFKEDTAIIPMSFKGYLSSSDSYWYWIIITLALATTVTVLIIPGNVIPLIYMRYLLVSIFILFLPGYSLVKLLFSTKELNIVERVALSVGMSLALVPLIGLILHYTPWGITTTPVTLSLLALTTILATATIIKEHQERVNKTRSQ